MNQTKLESFIEAKVNTISAFFISWGTMAWIIPLIFPLSGVNPSNSFGIVLIFTIISVIRNYLIRRYFNRRNTK